ncbi:hypothetical protein HWN40_03135 [Methanolobus zinderi]|uniref:DUF2769 domain-containing protein n=1 Tax=Methanolobus zinderi TaxID=536044 RepID=A0A7D5INK8_9EURY|nr:hypothetical protein [Methanolobus zinderi]QLC49327.1 hypothetical protein HWN40_03135 [Methanolobus zinderi]
MKTILNENCERCPNMSGGQCQSIEQVYSILKEDPEQSINPDYENYAQLFTECKEFPCKQIKLGPISCSYCPYLEGKAY